MNPSLDAFSDSLRRALTDAQRRGFSGICAAWERAIEEAVYLSARLATTESALSVDKLLSLARAAFGPALDQSYAVALREAKDSPLLQDIKDLLDQALSSIRQLELAAVRGVVEATLARHGVSPPPSLLMCRDHLQGILTQLTRLAKAHGPATPPSSLIALTVAAQRYSVSPKTLRLAIGDGRLTDHGHVGRAPNSPRRVDEAEVAALWPKRR